jgi:dihydroorotase
MDLLIKSAKIIDLTSVYHNQVHDVLIKSGRISEIAPSITEQDKIKTIKVEGLHLSPGWMDIGVQTGDPGLEHREDLQTVTAAAAAGGFTAIACQPNTVPVIQTQSDILYVRNQSRESVVDCYPLGAVSHDCKGEEITEMIDMTKAGAIGFTDGKHAIQHPGILLRALQYVKTFYGLIINQPLEATIASNGMLHEGIVSTSLGMKGIPSIAESLMVQRDLQLLEYTDSRLHLANISCAESVELVRQAKAKNLHVTASVPILNLIFDDTALEHFDSNLKVLPPLRSKSDRAALKAGLLDGTIDMISANHVPIEEEGKKLEFPYASFGAIGLETFYALYDTYLSEWYPIDWFVEMMTIVPRTLYALDPYKIEEQEKANMTLFLPKKEWKYDKGFSRSKNSPFIGQQLSGQIIGVINGEKNYINTI